MRVWLKLRYSRWRARVMATYISRRSSSRPSASDSEFSCGNRPSSMPVMNTAVELQALGGVHGHQLDRVLAGLRLVVAGFQRGMGQEGGQRRHDLAGLGIGRQIDRRQRQRRAGRDAARRQAAALLVHRQRHRILAETLLRDEGSRRR